jgi:hypothetical protein
LWGLHSQPEAHNVLARQAALHGGPDTPFGPFIRLDGRSHCLTGPGGASGGDADQTCRSATQG